MRNKITVLTVCAVLVAFCVSIEAQQPKKMARIGYLSPQSGPLRTPTLVAFKDGVRKFGGVGGKQIKFEYRYAAGDFDKLSEFATELVRLKVDVIVAGPGNAPVNAARRVTTTIPIVMVGVADPLSNGIVASLARPG